MKKIFLFIIFSALVNCYAQNSKNCTCEPPSFDLFMSFKKMNTSKIEDYLLNNCYQPGETGSISSGEKYKNYTKCHIKDMANASTGKGYKQGDYNIEICYDFYIKFHTNNVGDYLKIKRQISERATSNTREDDIDKYTVGSKSVHCLTFTNKDNNPVYMIIFYL